jgi:dipeptidyl-peptidase 4
MTRAIYFLLPVALVAAPVAAQRTDSTALTVPRIFSGTDFRPERFGPAKWLGDGAAYTTLERVPGAPGQDIVRYDSETGRREVLVSAAQLTPPGASAPLEIDEYAWSPDHRRLLVFTNTKPVWRLNTRGDYWVLDRTSGKLTRLGGPAKPSTLLYAKFDPSGTRVGYVRENDLYVEELAGGTITRLTSDGSRTVINGNFDWVYEEELGLHDGWRWSPDGTRIAYWQLNADRVRDFLLYRTTDSIYSAVEPVQYPKAGEENSSARIGVVSASGGATRWLAFSGDPRSHYLARMEWAASSDELVVQRLNRLQNTLELVLADARTGAVRPILTERDSTWVEVVDRAVWVDGGARLTWTSERDGWNKVYTVPRAGGSPRVITPGRFDVLDIAGTDDRTGWLYYLAAPGEPTRRFLYRSKLDGSGTPERVTPAGATGSHSYDIAPGARWAFHTRSSFGVPPVTELVRLPEHQVVRTLVGNTRLTEQVAAVRRGPAEFFQVSIGDSISLNGWMIKPPGFDPSRKYPVVYYVYGGPGSQTVVDAWGGTTYLWHLLLAQQGIIVASVDNRGTGARGRDWRKIIYGKLGVVETHDQAAAALSLARERSYIDSARMGIWGWSYGGFMSLNGLFQAPDVYSTAVAVAPVTHWTYYDNIYTERYNGLPKDNAAGYDQGSPLSYVGKMKGKLLLVHGSGDDNVHFQNTESLVNALVAANKQFRFMEYPNRNHSIAGGNTSVHLRTLLTDFLTETLLGSAPRPPLTP